MRIGLVLLCVVWASNLFAAVTTRTLIRNMEIGGASERAGLCQIWVDGNDFPTASLTTPVIIRLKLDKEALLSETLVDLTSFSNRLPAINLPIALKGITDLAYINAPESAASIVRWVEGEDSIWLKITFSSSRWLFKESVPMAPSVITPAVITVGRTIAEATAANESDFNNSWVNLITPTRQKGGPVETPMQVNLENSTIEPAPSPGSALNMDATAFYSNSVPIVTRDDRWEGNTILITGDRIIGRAMASPNKRWLLHMPKVDRGSSGKVIFNNQHHDPATLTLRPFNAQGDSLGDISLDFSAKSLAMFSSSDLFGEEDFSHFQILGPKTCHVIVTDQSNKTGGLTTQIQASRPPETTWDLLLDPNSGSHEKLHLVNTGEMPAELIMTFFDENGEVLNTYAFEELLSPKAKLSFNLVEWLPLGMSPAMVRFSSSQSMGVLVLRGMKDVQGEEHFFPVHPIALQSQ